MNAALAAEPDLHACVVPKLKPEASVAPTHPPAIVRVQKLQPDPGLDEPPPKAGTERRGYDVQNGFVPGVDDPKDIVHSLLTKNRYRRIYHRTHSPARSFQDLDEMHVGQSNNWNAVVLSLTKL